MNRHQRVKEVQQYVQNINLCSSGSCFNEIPTGQQTGLENDKEAGNMYASLFRVEVQTFGEQKQPAFFSVQRRTGVRLSRELIN